MARPSADFWNDGVAPALHPGMNTRETALLDYSEEVADAAQAAAESTASGALSTHASDTTSVHGIADTSALATTTDIATHNSDETAVHGIPNTALIPLVNVFSVTWPTRPDATIVFWIGGDASDDDPSADMEIGDVWFPHSE